MNPGSGACSEPRWRHCTPAWATERDSVSKKKKNYFSSFIILHLIPHISSSHLPTRYDAQAGPLLAMWVLGWGTGWVQDVMCEQGSLGS